MTTGSRILERRQIYLAQSQTRIPNLGGSRTGCKPRLRPKHVRPLWGRTIPRLEAQSRANPEPKPKREWKKFTKTENKNTTHTLRLVFNLVFKLCIRPRGCCALASSPSSPGPPFALGPVDDFGLRIDIEYENLLDGADPLEDEEGIRLGLECAAIPAPTPKPYPPSTPPTTSHRLRASFTSRATSSIALFAFNRFKMSGCPGVDDWVGARMEERSRGYLRSR